MSLYKENVAKTEKEWQLEMLQFFRCQTAFVKHNYV